MLGQELVDDRHRHEEGLGDGLRRFVSPGAWCVRLTGRLTWHSERGGSSAGHCRGATAAHSVYGYPPLVSRWAVTPVAASHVCVHELSSGDTGRDAIGPTVELPKGWASKRGSRSLNPSTGTTEYGPADMLTL